MYIYLVCEGDVEGHSIKSAWSVEKHAIQVAKFLIAGSTRKFSYDDTQVEGREIALWAAKHRDNHSRIYGYISVEKHKLSDK